MIIGIDASFLRKRGTGIGQVTFNFLEKLKEFPISNSQFQKNSENSNFKNSNIDSEFNSPIGGQNSKFILYTEESVDMELPANFEVKLFLPKRWKRDDVIRKILWEREVSQRAMADGCEVFLSLYQSSVIFKSSIRTPHPALAGSSPWTRFDGAKARREGEQEEVNDTIRHVMVVHDIIPKLFPEYVKKWSRKWYWRGVERGIRSADHIVSVSEATKRDIVRELGVSAEKMSVSYLGLSPLFERSYSDAEIDAVLKKYGLERGYIYHGGGLEVRKNAEGVLRAYRLLCDKFQISNFKFQNKSENFNFKMPTLVISGKIFAKGNPLATDVEGLVSELHLENDVKLLGFVPEKDLPALYAAASFFVFPSRYEGFGIPPLEAMAMGCPVLVSKVSSLPEVCGDAAEYCDPSSVESIAAGMETLTLNEQRRSELSLRGREQSQRFSYEAFARGMLEVIGKEKS